MPTVLVLSMNEVAVYCINLALKSENKVCYFKYSATDGVIAWGNNGKLSKFKSAGKARAMVASANALLY